MSLPQVRWGEVISYGIRRFIQKPTQKDAATVKRVKSRTKGQPNRDTSMGKSAGLTARLTRNTAIREGAAPRSLISLRIGYQANIGPV